MKSILLLEEEAAIGETVGQALGHFGLRADVVQTVEAACSRLRESEFDIVVMDYRESGENGSHSRGSLAPACLPQLRTARQGIPVLIYSGLGGIADNILSVVPPDDPLKNAPAFRLALQIRATIGRQGQQPNPMWLDGAEGSWSTEENPLSLTVEGAKLLSRLGGSQSRTVPSQEIIDRVYKGDLQRLRAAGGRFWARVSGRLRRQ